MGLLHRGNREHQCATPMSRGLLQRKWGVGAIYQCDECGQMWEAQAKNYGYAGLGRGVGGAWGAGFSQAVEGDFRWVRIGRNVARAVAAARGEAAQRGVRSAEAGAAGRADAQRAAFEEKRRAGRLAAEAKRRGHAGVTI